MRDQSKTESGRPNIRPRTNCGPTPGTSTGERAARGSGATFVALMAISCRPRVGLSLNGQPALVDRQVVEVGGMIASPNGFAGVYDEPNAAAGSSKASGLLSAAVTRNGGTPVQVDLHNGSDHYGFV